MSTASRAIAVVATMGRMTRGDTFAARTLRPAMLEGLMDPLLMVDHYEMGGATFLPHPHAGFSAVTYMFEDSAGSFRNRDSRGDDSIIAPGDLHWTVAGRGIVHEEVPTRPGVVCHGLQIFVNLAARDKFVEPGAVHVDSAAIPVATPATGARVKVVTGASHGLRSPARIPSDLTLLDVQLAPGRRIAVPTPPDANAIAIVISGGGLAGPAGERVECGQAVAFAPAGALAVVELQAGADGVHAVLFAAQPLNEPVHQQGPFAMATPEDLARVTREYQAGAFGSLEPASG